MTSTTTLSSFLRVPLVEVAARLGTSTEMVLGWLPEGEVVKPDDLGRPSIDPTVASKLVAERLEAGRRHEEQIRAHEAYLADRARRRAEVVGKARDVTYSRTYRPQRAMLLPDGRQEGAILVGVRDSNAEELAREAAREAGEAFDRREPALGLADWLASREGRPWR